MTFPTPKPGEPERDLRSAPAGSEREFRPASGESERPFRPGPGESTDSGRTADNGDLNGRVGGTLDPSGERLVHRDGVPNGNGAYRHGTAPADAEQPAPYAPPATLEPPEPAPSWGARGLVALAVAAVIAVLGLPLGWLWSSVAPWLPGVVESDGLFLAQPYGEQRAGAETWFIMLSVGAGIVFAIVAWLTLRRFRGPLMVVALAVGGIAASWLMWRFGHNIGRGHALEMARHGKVGQIVLVPPDIRIKQTGNIATWHGLPYLSGVLLYLAIAAIVVYLLIASFTSNPGLIPRRKRDGEPDLNHAPSAPNAQ